MARLHCQLKFDYNAKLRYIACLSVTQLGLYSWQCSRNIYYAHNYLFTTRQSVSIADLCLTNRGVDPGGDEGDASPPAIGVGGMDNTIIPPGFTNDFNYYYYYSNKKVSLLTLSFYVS